MMIIGITGRPPSKSGKDTVADHLVKEYGFVKVALADPMKRFCMEMFGWSAEDLWGSSENRNEPDLRYIRMREGALGSSLVGWNDDGTRRDDPNPVEDIHLTPRYALQRLGTEWGRGCYQDVWVDYCLRVAKKVMFGQEHKTHDKWDYRQDIGLFPWNEGPMEDIKGIVIPDVRFDNEAAAIQKAGGKIWCIEREGAGLEGEAGTHASEVGVSHCLIDEYLINNRDIPWLLGRADQLMKMGYERMGTG